MRIQVQSDADAAATAGAKFIADQAREAVAARGRFVMAVSGGHVPWQMFRILANETMPWKDVHLVQVDERVAPAGDQDRKSDTPARKFAFTSAVAVQASPRDAGGGK